MQKSRIKSGQVLKDGCVSLRLELRAFPCGVLKIGIQFPAMTATAWVVCLGFGCELAVPSCTLLYHAENASVISWQQVCRCVGSSMVDGVQVGTDVAHVGISMGAGVSGDAPDGRLELLKRAFEDGECGPSMGMDAKLTI